MVLRSAWALRSLATHLLAPGFLLLLLESERPGEGLQRAWGHWSFPVLSVYAFTVAFLTSVVAGRWARPAGPRAASNEGLILALVAFDAACGLLAWTLAQVGSSAVFAVPALPSVAAVALLAGRRLAKS